MFQFPWFPSTRLCIHLEIPKHYFRWVSPFGNLWIIDCLHLPKAYRSLPRPSSPADAKASIVRPYYLDQNPFNLALIPRRDIFSRSHYAVVKERTAFAEIMGGSSDPCLSVRHA